LLPRLPQKRWQQQIRIAISASGSVLGWGGLSNLLVLAVVWLVVGGIAYLGFRRRGGVTFTQAIFTWPVIGVTAIMDLLFIFA
jgi:hypothetical protein